MPQHPTPQGISQCPLLREHARSGNRAETAGFLTDQAVESAGQVPYLPLRFPPDCLIAAEADAAVIASRIPLWRPKAGLTPAELEQSLDRFLEQAAESVLISTSIAVWREVCRAGAKMRESDRMRAWEYLKEVIEPRVKACAAVWIRNHRAHCLLDGSAADPYSGLALRLMVRLFWGGGPSAKAPFLDRFDVRKAKGMVQSYIARAVGWALWRLLREEAGWQDSAPHRLLCDVARVLEEPGYRDAGAEDVAEALIRNYLRIYRDLAGDGSRGVSLVQLASAGLPRPWYWSPEARAIKQEKLTIGRFEDLIRSVFTVGRVEAVLRRLAGVSGGDSGDEEDSIAKALRLLRAAHAWLLWRLKNPDHRQTFREMWGCSYAEIASRLGIRENLARQHKVRIILDLKAYLTSLGLLEPEEVNALLWIYRNKAPAYHDGGKPTKSGEGVPGPDWFEHLEAAVAKLFGKGFCTSTNGTICVV